MAKVTIEGSTSPSTYLARGERIEVQRTDHIERLIKGGFVTVIDEEGHAEPAPLPEPIKPPTKSGSRQAWADFLDEHTSVEVGDKTRDELVDAYDDYLSTHDAPAAED